MKRILIIGIGAGNPEYMTLQAVKALNQVDVFFVMDKGAAKDKLIELRREICRSMIEGNDYRFAEANSPERVRDVADYRGSVEDLNDDKQHVIERLIADELRDGECGAFLTWGDPSLYDSTIRIMDAIIAKGGETLEYEVIPGITSIQALTAKHKIPLNLIGEAVHITTGRKLAEGFPENANTVVVMLDSQNAYKLYVDLNIDIYWGAYLGTPDEILVSGKLGDVADEIERVRKEARHANGWIMDTYLLRRNVSPKPSAKAFPQT